MNFRVVKSKAVDFLSNYRTDVCVILYNGIKTCNINLSTVLNQDSENNFVQDMVSWLVPHSPKWCPAYLTLPGNKIYLGDSSANLEDTLLPLDQVLFHVKLWTCCSNRVLQIRNLKCNIWTSLSVNLSGNWMHLEISGWWVHKMYAFKIVFFLVKIQQSETSCSRISDFFAKLLQSLFTKSLIKNIEICSIALIGSFIGLDILRRQYTEDVSLFWILHLNWYIAVYMTYKESLFLTSGSTRQDTSVCAEPRRTLVSPMFARWYHPLLFAPIVMYFLLDADK